MALNVNTNVASLNAQRNLTKSGSELGVSLQRLSTGLRINSAKDDAAGLAISERFTTQIRGLNQASRNANDAISLSQTAEGSLQEVGNNLQRIRELAVQSANATNSTSDRAALDSEVQQLLAEIDRVGTTTSFNGVKLLDGSFQSQKFQVGANAGETVGVSLGNFTALQLGKTATGTGTVDANTMTTLSIGIGGVNTSVKSSADYADASNLGNNGGGADSAYAKARAINASAVPGLTATTTDAVHVATGGSALDLADTEAYKLEINGNTIIDITSADGDTNSDLTASELVDVINGFQGSTNVVASFDGTNISLTSRDGRSIEVTETGADVALAAASGVAEFAYGGVKLSASENITFTGADATTIGQTDGGSITLGSNGISTQNVTTVDNASDMINAVDAALSTINSARADLGAIQNRFESVIANIQTSSENLSAARSRIQDADFAAETAALTRNQILQQAGVSILAQANALPQLALSLLQ